jgi:hypothetical protein
MVRSFAFKICSFVAVIAKELGIAWNECKIDLIPFRLFGIVVFKLKNFNFVFLKTSEFCDRNIEE